LIGGGAALGKSRLGLGKGRFLRGTIFLLLCFKSGLQRDRDTSTGAPEMSAALPRNIAPLRGAERPLRLT